MNVSTGSGRKVGAVVVTFRPDLERLRLVLEAATTQVEEVIVVDNASPSRGEIAALVEAIPGARLEPLAENLGIGAALNTGVVLHLESGRDWVLTLDQDTVAHEGAVPEVLDALERLSEPLRRAVGVAGMSRGIAAPSGRRRQWVERSLVVADLERFSERRIVITSGNLVRADVYAKVRYDETLFIDHVDTRFCADVRRRGWRVLEYRRHTMDHRLGTTVRVRRGERIYEGGERIYYLTRNGLSLALRGDLPARVLARDVVGLSTVYVEVNGPCSVPRCLSMVMSGARDAVLRRSGPRGRRRRAGARAEP